MEMETHTETAQALQLSRWILAVGASLPNIQELLKELCSQLHAFDIPVDRIFLGSVLIHPEVAGEAYSYRKATDQFTYTELSFEAFEVLTNQQDSPIQYLLHHKKLLRARLDAGQNHGMQDLVDLKKEGYTDFVALPVWSGGKLYAGVSYATLSTDGFSDANLALLDTVSLALGTVAGLIWRERLQSILLQTYLGVDAGLRVHNGEVRRGDWQQITAAVWFCDMRNFTQLSTEHSTAEMREMINEVFEVVVNTIRDGGGQVLKFIGDALLAVFTHDQDQVACQNALEAGIAAGQRVNALAVSRRSAGKAATSIGISLHFGEVSYGNIGAKKRLDFTVIGPAVNLTSRIEGLCGRLKEQLLMSRQFCDLVSAETRPLGAHRLRGVEGEVEVFGLAETEDS
jgi:adenylate cyclase